MPTAALPVKTAPRRAASAGLLANVRAFSELPEHEQEQVLREMEGEEAVLDDAAAEEGLARREVRYGLEGGLRLPWRRAPRAFDHRSHVFGYLPNLDGETTRDTAGDTMPILPLAKAPADGSLTESGVDVTLDRMHVADYPGRGDHHILFAFETQNHLQDGAAEQVAFNTTWVVRDGETAPVINLPLFVGLQPGPHSLQLGCATINVSNRDDERFLAFLQSKTFRAGLRLVKTAQPALAPFAETAVKIAEHLTKANRNVCVQKFQLGLDLAPRSTGARLAPGSYVAVQVPGDVQARWTWDGWGYDVARGAIVDRAGLALAYNHVVLGVSRHAG